MNEVIDRLKLWRDERNITEPIGHPEFQSAIESEVDEYTVAVHQKDEYEKIDAIGDIITLCLNELALEGYSAAAIMNQIVTEISSREQDPEQASRDWSGEKWKKNKDQDPDSLYKADFKHCKLEPR